MGTRTMHLCSKVEMQQLFHMLNNGKSPEKLPVRAILWSTVRGYVDYEVFADDWPRFSALVLRPNPQWKPRLKSSFFTYAKDYEKLRDLLCNRNIVPWNREKIIFAACNSRTGSILQSIAAQYSVQLALSSECDVFSFDDFTPSTKHRSFVPAGFYFDHVRSDEAVIVNKYWNLSLGKESELLIQQMAEHMPSACIRNEDGDMVSWSMLDFDGQMGKGYTLEQYRRRHFNHLIGKELLWRCRNLGFSVCTYIVKDNQASQTHIREKGDATSVDRFSDAYTWWVASAGDNSKL